MIKCNSHGGESVELEIEGKVVEVLSELDLILIHMICDPHDPEERVFLAEHIAGLLRKIVDAGFKPETVLINMIKEIKAHEK